MTVAYLVFSHQYPDQLLRLLRTLREASADAPLISHHNGALDPAPLAALGVERVLPPTRVTWGGASQLLMMLRGMRHALERTDFDWLVLLSGQDYPLRPLHAIERDLETSGVDGFVEGVEVAPGADDEFARRYLYRYRRVREPGRLVRRALRAARPRVLMRDLPGSVLVGRRATPPLPVRRGSDWLTLSRRAVAAVTGVAPDVLDHFRRTILPTEALPHSVLYADPTLRLSGDTRRYTRWAPGTPHPAVLGVADLEDMLASGLDFARKFDVTVDARVLDELDSVVRDRAR